jgi:pimeloyl-ACP methyl ester carboxylesterase
MKKENAMYVEISGKRIAYDERGEGRPILFLHGWPLDRRSMVGSFEPIFQHRTGWRRVYPDLPGMGETGAVPGVSTQDGVLDLIVEFASHVAERKPFGVVGLSYGGLLAQGLTFRMGSSMSGLLAVVPGMAEREKRILPEFRVIHRKPVDFSGVDDEAKQGFESMAVVQTQEHLRAWQELILPGVAAADDGFLAELDKRYGFSFDHRRPPRPFEAPTLFLTGRQDSVCGYRQAWEVLESYPRASFVVLDRAGHCLNFEQPTLFAALVHEWLDRVEEYIETDER